MASEKTLAARSRKDLAQLAKHNNVEGWHSMKKADLIDALKNRRLTEVPAKKSVTERSQALRAQSGNGAHAPLRRTPRKSKASPDQRAKSAGHLPVRLAANAPAGQSEMLRATAQGAHWIYASWRLSAAILERAEASLGTNWHQAAPVLRVYDLHVDEATSPTKRCIASIPIQSAADHWYVPIADPGRAYELQLGYETSKGHYFMLARSASVKLPMPGTPQARKYDEQRQAGALPTQIADTAHRFPIRGSSAFRFSGEVSLDVAADLMIVGRVSPQAHLTCLDEGISVQPDGLFEIRLGLAEGRQVIPLEAISPDGCQSRTMILAIERNTKTLEPQSLNEWDD
jgi:uncharacterized protein